MNKPAPTADPGETPPAQPADGGAGRPAPQDEYTLYHEQPEQWAALVSPRWVVMLDKADDERVLFLWRAARGELKRAIWQQAGAELKDRIKRITSESPA
jgi:hypothetical protein